MKFDNLKNLENEVFEARKIWVENVNAETTKNLFEKEEELLLLNHGEKAWIDKKESIQSNMMIDSVQILKKEL